MSKAAIKSIGLRIHLLYDIVDLLPKISQMFFLLICYLFILQHLMQLIFLLYCQRSIGRLAVKKVQINSILLLLQWQCLLIWLIRPTLRIKATLRRSDLQRSLLPAKRVARLLLGFYVDLPCSFRITHSFSL